MRPILFELGGFAFASWYVFFFLAAFFGYAFLYYSLLRTRVDTAIDTARPLFLLCYFSGWLGSRALSIAVEQFNVTSLRQFFVELFSIGPMTFYGGALLAFTVGSGYVLWKRAPYGVVADCFVPATVLALGVGRIGCFLNGDDYGLPIPQQSSPPWWAVNFPNLRDGLFRYPTQLEEAAASFVIVIACSYFFRKHYPQNSGRYWPGQIALFAVFASAANRFLNEFFRGDLRGYFLGSALSTSQGVALLLLVAVFMVTGWKKLFR